MILIHQAKGEIVEISYLSFSFIYQSQSAIITLHIIYNFNFKIVQKA